MWTWNILTMSPRESHSAICMLIMLTRRQTVNLHNCWSTIQGCCCLLSAIETTIRRQLSLLLRGELPRHRNNCTFLNVMFHMRPSSPWRHVVLRLRLEYWPRHDHDLPPLTIQNITYSSWLLYQIIKCWSILVRQWMVRTENCWGTNLRAAVQTKQWPTWKLNSVQVKDLKLCREVLYQR